MSEKERGDTHSHARRHTHTQRERERETLTLTHSHRKRKRESVRLDHWYALTGRMGRLHQEIPVVVAAL